MKVHEETDKAASAEEAQDKLKAQIKKQRQEIMSKTAAATSGNIYRCIFPALVPYRKALFFVPVLFFCLCLTRLECRCRCGRKAYHRS